jgi:hypothetical protein
MVFAVHLIARALDPKGYPLEDEEAAGLAALLTLHDCWRDFPNCRWEKTTLHIASPTDLRYRTEELLVEASAYREGKISLSFFAPGQKPDPLILKMSFRVDITGSVEMTEAIYLNLALLLGHEARIAALWVIDKGLCGGIDEFLRRSRVPLGYYNVHAQPAKWLLEAKEASAPEAA